MQDRGQVKTGGLPVVYGLGGIEQLGQPHRFGDTAEAKGREVLAYLLGDVLEERLDELGLPGEPLAQLGVLGRDPDRARVEVTHPHHDAPGYDQRCGRESELLRAEQRRHDDVPAGFELAVGLDDDAVAQAVEQQRLLGLGQPELPWCSGVLDAG
jgi:hypothetical protein